MDKPQIEIYKIDDRNTGIAVNLINDSVWLNMSQIVELFERDKSLIFRHINNVFKEGELQKKVQLLHFLQQLPPMVKRIK